MSTISRVSIVSVFALLMACGGGPGSGGNADLDASQSLERIVGGAAFSAIPAVGSLTISGQNYCTGTLISARRVVTAAHCLEEYQPSQFTFAIGTNTASPTKTYQVASGAANPNWNSTTLLGDVAYLDLTTDATEAPVKVLAGMDNTWVNVDLTFVGFGVDDGQRQSGNGIKRAVVMPISEMGDSQFAYETAGLNTCNGDSGGPAFFIDNAGNYLLAGTTSYGDTYCTQYGVDTIASVYASWLGVTAVAPATGGGSDGGDSDGGGDTDSGGDSDTGGDSGGGDTGGGDSGGDSGGGDTTTGCGGESFTGRCDGNIVHWCENSTQYEVDCTRRNKVCMYSPVEGYYGCAVPTETQQPVDPCNGETYAGRCDGATVIWCEDNFVQSLACGAFGGSCGLDTSRQVYNCLYGQ